MNSLELVWVVLGVALCAYVLTGGADFGAGLWHLLARGPRKAAQREALAHAIAPIWEANHIWLIFLVVLLFTVFPRAFGVISTTLHVPLVAALVGIVLRGAAFTFAAYGAEERAGPRWSVVFAWSSVLAPVCLGAALAALGTGALIDEAGRPTGYFVGWTTPFALFTGLFAVALFALLAAVYMVRATEGDLADDFRRRALAAEVVAGLLAALTFARAGADAPPLFAGLVGSAWTWPVQLGTAASAAACIYCLVRRHDRAARYAAAAQVCGVVLGFGAALDHHLVLPSMPLDAAGARPEVMGALLPVLALGGLILVPALVYLYRLFQGARPGGRLPRGH